MRGLKEGGIKKNLPIGGHTLPLDEPILSKDNFLIT